jgi:hypothetical protein
LTEIIYAIQRGEAPGADQAPDTLQFGFDRVGLDTRGWRVDGLNHLRRVVAGEFDKLMRCWRRASAESDHSGI